MIELVAASATDVGRVRAANEDNVLVSEDLLAVADGMGGHVGGEVASRTAIAALSQAFAGDRSVHGLLDAVRQANQAILEQSRLDPELRGMGTTLTAAALVRVPESILLLEPETSASRGSTGPEGERPGPSEERAGALSDGAGEHRIVLVNIGDSRAYLFSAGRLLQLTEDHSLVEEMVRNGELTPEEAAVHPHRNILTRALGIDLGAEVDAFVLSTPPSARLLLCSDGLTNELGDREIAAILERCDDPQKVANELVRQAVDHGGNDNVTVVVADLVTGASSGVLEGDSAALGGVAPGSVALIRIGSRPAPVARTHHDLPLHTGTTGVVTAALSSGGSGSRLPPSTPLTGHHAAAIQPRLTPSAGRSLGVLSSGAERRVDADGTGGGYQLLVPLRGDRRYLGDRVVTPRVVLFVVLLVAIIGGAVGSVAWYAGSSYYVGLYRHKVVIFQGQPGGVLFLHPTIVEASSLGTSSVFAGYLPALRSGVEEPSYSAASALLRRLESEKGHLPFLRAPSHKARSGVGSAAVVARPAVTNPTTTSTARSGPTTTTGPTVAVAGPTITTRPSATARPTATTEPRVGTVAGGR